MHPVSPTDITHISPIQHPTIMPLNTRPDENAANIINDTCKWKALECSILSKIPAHIGPKKMKVTTTTGKKKQMAKLLKCLVTRKGATIGHDHWDIPRQYSRQISVD